MQCRSCGHDNRPGAAFCGECGGSLLRATCPDCGAEHADRQKFCDACGAALEPARDAPSLAPNVDLRDYTPAHLAEKILRDRPRLEGERRTVTVLFADAVGFTTLSEEQGEETVYSLMQGCFARMMDAVHRYEGTITQFLGDGVMALFGAPIANEDSARRAVAAALAMQRALLAYASDIIVEHGIDVRFRVGLNTGPVVVGKIGDNLDMDYTAIGDTINTAARLQALAEPGSVYLSESTRRAVSGYVDCEPLGQLMVKGKAEPVTAFKALGERPVRSRLDAAVERGLTALVGRDRELALLRGYLDEARQGRGQVVLLSGDAGIGKSRLLLEFRRALGPDVAWIEGHCISYGSNIPYLPIIELVKARYGITDDDDEAKIIQRVDEGTEHWDERAKQGLPYLKYLLNVDPGDPAVLAMDAVARRAGIFDALRTSAVQNTRDAPSVLVVEDLHWIDVMSQEALSAVVDVVTTVPVLMILTYRPGFSQPLGDRADFHRIALGPLPAGETTAMAQNVLGAVSLPPSLQHLIAGKSDGNPFYIEELTKSLLESGVLRDNDGIYALARPVDEVQVPDTIQEIILTRIDRLEPVGKSALQLASVIGREFTVRLLQRISDLRAELDHVLVGLKGLELIYEKSYLPELSYMFKHALTHDVAYSTLLNERRKFLHRGVAASIEELYAERLGEHFETLAHHYFEGEDWAKALDYLIKAAHKASDAYANGDALGYYDRALAAARRVDGVPLETLADILSGRAQVCLALNSWDGAIASYEELAERARAVGDRTVEGQALGGIGFVLVMSHDFEGAEEKAEEALAIADELGDDAVRAGAMMIMTFLKALRGDPAAAMVVGAETARLARETEQPLYECFCGELFILGHSWRCLFDDAHRHAEEEVARAARYGMAESLAFNMWARGLALASNGRYTEAINSLDEAITFCRRIGDTVVQSRAWNTLGWAHGELYDFELGVQYNERGLGLALEVGDPEITINAQLNLADYAMATGEHQKALRELEGLYASVPGVHEWMKWRYTQHLQHSLGEALLIAGDVPRALSLAEDCIALAVETDSRKNVIKGRRLRGQALAALGNLDEADGELAEALNVAQAAGNPPQLWKTWAVIGALRLGRDDEARSRHAFAAAAAVIDEVAAGLTDERLQQTFLSAAAVVEIRARAAQS